MDAISYHDAVSDSEDLLDSAYSPHATPRPSFNPSTRPDPPASKDGPSAHQDSTQPPSSSSNGTFSSGQDAERRNQTLYSSDAAQSPSFAQSNQALPNANGSTHALTSSHHSAAPLSESAEQAASEQPTIAGRQQSAGAVEAREAKLEGLLEVYEEPDSYAGLYNYAKALEDVEAGLLAGFFYKHFSLASNVIGSESKGQLCMSMPVFHLPMHATEMLLFIQRLPVCIMSATRSLMRGLVSLGSR